MFHSVEPVSILLIVPSVRTLLILWESQSSLNQKSLTLWLCSLFTAGMAIACLCFKLLISKKMVCWEFIQQSKSHFMHNNRPFVCQTGGLNSHVLCLCSLCFVNACVCTWPSMLPMTGCSLCPTSYVHRIFDIWDDIYLQYSKNVT
jgi:hypothetical protein